MTGYRNLVREVSRQRAELLERLPRIRHRTGRLRNAVRTPAALVPAFLCGVALGRLVPRAQSVAGLFALLRQGQQAWAMVRRVRAVVLPPGAMGSSE